MKFEYPIFALLLMSALPSTSNSSYCSSLESSTYFFTTQRTTAGMLKRVGSRRTFQIHVTNNTLVGWPTQNGDYVKSGLVSVDGCRAIFSPNDTCTLALWDGESRCFLSGIGLSGHPSVIISDFGNRNDVGFVFIEENDGKAIIQIDVYRANVGVIYSRTLPNSGVFRLTKNESILDSIETHTKIRIISQDVIRSAQSSVEQIKGWLKKLKRAKSGSAATRIKWSDIKTSN